MGFSAFSANTSRLGKYSSRPSLRPSSMTNSQSDLRSPISTTFCDTASMKVPPGPLMWRWSLGSSRSRLPAAGSTTSASAAVGVMNKSCTTKKSSLFSASMIRAELGKQVTVLLPTTMNVFTG